MTAPVNTLKARLSAGAPTVGLWLASGEALLAEVAATAGFDWLLIDGEHAPNDVRSIGAQLAVLGGVPAIARPRDHDPAAVKQLLDAGVQTLLFPMVETAAQARALVAATRYPPAGIRGMGAGVARAGLWGAVSDYAATADAQICVILQIENRAGLAAIEEIAAVEGVDGLFVGPADLAADMGFGPRPEAPEVRAAVFDALRRIRAAGCVAGVYAAEEAFAAECRAAGATMIAAGADLAILGAALRGIAAARRS